MSLPVMHDPTKTGELTLNDKLAKRVNWAVDKYGIGGAMKYFWRNAQANWATPEIARAFSYTLGHPFTTTQVRNIVRDAVYGRCVHVTWDDDKGDWVH